MTAKNEDVKGWAGLPLFTELPRRLILGNSEGIKEAGV